MKNRILYIQVVYALLLFFGGFGNLYSLSLETTVEQRSQQRLNEFVQKRIKPTSITNRTNNPLMRAPLSASLMSTTEPFEGYFSIMFQENEFNVTKTITIDWNYDLFNYYDYNIGADFFIFYKAPSNIDSDAKPIAHITTTYSAPSAFVCVHDNDVPIQQIRSSAACEFSLYMDEDYSFEMINAHWITTSLTPLPNSYLDTALDSSNPNKAEAQYREITKDAPKTPGIITVSVTLTKQGVAPPDQSLPLPTAPAFSTTQNYINTRTYTSADGKYYLDRVQYFDGLGRPNQQIQRESSPSRKDIAILQEYDSFGRESNIWLPAVINSQKGSFVTDTTVRANSISSNGNDQKPYSYPTYESSPLNRVLEQYDPGQDWQKNSKAVRTAYKTNILGNVQLNCVIYTATGTNESPLLSKGNNYATGELYVTESKNEDNSIFYEFKDKLGQVVLTRQTSGGINHDTYYVYNDFGNLCFVLPPSIEENIVADNLNKYAYQYKYDHRNRCTWKKLPGAEPIYYVYDKSDQLIFTQTGEQRANGKSEWTFTIDDAFGRNVLTGIYWSKIKVGASTAETAIAIGCLDAVVVRGRWGKVTNTNKGYTITGLTFSATANPVIIGANYYDSYEFMGLNSIPAYTDANFKPSIFTDYGVHYTASHKGLLTGTLTAQMLPAGGISTTYLYSVMYYDSQGRLLQTKSNNHLTGGVEVVTMAYNFIGQPVKKHLIHQINNEFEFYDYVYDHAGRLKEIYHKYSIGEKMYPRQLIASNTYDELGRLKENKKGGKFNTTYAYNIRSWTKSIESKNGATLLFNQTLYYNDKVTAHSYSDYKPSYSGNVSGMEWQLQGESKRSNRFIYDELSRLTHSAYNGVVSGGAYNTSYTYDKHGNIKNLVQRGIISGTTSDVVDNLQMEYVGNQLNNVHNVGKGLKTATSAHFQDYSKDANKAKKEYTYNANGAMTQDLNKGITRIQYNSLNLPQLMDIKSPVGEARNEYTYSAGGQKLRVYQKWNPAFNTNPIIGSDVNVSAMTASLTTDYVGNKIYENGVLKRTLIDGGYIEGGVYHYYLTDHLGNNRVVVNASGAVIQKTHYYPFGMAFAETTGMAHQPYKYNGKELDTKHGLNTYDYAARYMDPAIGRFTSIDPLAEKYYSWSPYAYVANNPLRYIDPDGKSLRGGSASLLPPMAKNEIETYVMLKIANKGAEVSAFKSLTILTTALISAVDDSRVACTFNITQDGLEFIPVSYGEVSETASMMFFPGPKGSSKGLGNKYAPNPRQGAWERGQIKNADNIANKQVIKHNNLKGNEGNRVGDSGGELSSNYNMKNNSNLKNGAILTGTGVSIGAVVATQIGGKEDARNPDNNNHPNQVQQKSFWQTVKDIFK